MAQTDLPQPPPTKDGLLDRWLFLLWKKITATGSILWSQIVLPDESANTFLAGPTTGADAQVTFRALVTADLPAGTGTVTSVAMSVPTGLTVTGSPITTSGTLALSYTAGYAIPTTAKQTEWDTAYSDRLKWDGGATGLVAATGRTSLGATTVGGNVFTLTNPSAITFPRFNADNTVSALDAATFRTAIGAGTGAGSVTSVDVSGGTTGLTFSGGPIATSGTITMAGTLDADNGGTGQSSYAVGDLLYASTTTALSKLADVSAGSYLRSGGVNTAPLWSTLKLPNAATNGRLVFASATDTYGEDADLSFDTSTNQLSSGTFKAATTIGVGAATPSTSGAGITFPATQSSSTDANTLDDYEEGTFTPVLAFGGASVGITYATQTADYTKIGNSVRIRVSVIISSKGSSTGAAQITGLPFTSQNTAGTNAPLAPQIGLAAVTWATMAQLQIPENSTLINMQRFAAGTATGITDADFNATTSVRAAGIYPT